MHLLLAWLQRNKKGAIKPPFFYAAGAAMKGGISEMGFVNIYRSFKVDNPMSANTLAMIQKRITTVASGHPFFSK